MSNDKLPTALNLYSILDNELSRMHGLLNSTIEREYRDAHSNRYSSHANVDISEFYKRITMLQDLLLQALVSNDKVLQERIAELALMGQQKDESPK